MTLTWAEVASIEVDDRWAVVTATDGRKQRIDLGDVFQPQAVREALTPRARFSTRPSCSQRIY
jgi:hypothetical protein